MEEGRYGIYGEEEVGGGMMGAGVTFFHRLMEIQGRARLG